MISKGSLVPDSCSRQLKWAKGFARGDKKIAVSVISLGTKLSAAYVSDLNNIFHYLERGVIEFDYLLPRF